MNKNQRQQFFQTLSEHISNPTTELNYRNEFELLIAVILSAQATDVSVNKATPKLFQAAATPAKMAAATKNFKIPFIYYLTFA